MSLRSRLRHSGRGPLPACQGAGGPGIGASCGSVREHPGAATVLLVILVFQAWDLVFKPIVLVDVARIWPTSLAGADVLTDNRGPPKTRWRWLMSAASGRRRYGSMPPSPAAMLWRLPSGRSPIAFWDWITSRLQGAVVALQASLAGNRETMHYPGRHGTPPSRRSNKPDPTSSFSCTGCSPRPCR